MNKASDGLKARLAEAGFEVVETPLTEFLKAGGAAKCLTLRVTEPPHPELPGESGILSRTITMTGHLLDTGLVNRALDLVVEGGGSFQVLKFDLGETAPEHVHRRNSRLGPRSGSDGRNHGAVDRFGCRCATPQNEQDANLVTITQAGVAPDDFYKHHHLYPTEVRVKGTWIPPSAISVWTVFSVVHQSGSELTAECKLLRDLQVNDQVVVGYEGIRSVRRHHQIETGQGKKNSALWVRESPANAEFELVVEQVAWEMRRLRDQGGRVVVVAGPVVIHTGGSDHLSRLIRDGYVQALLGWGDADRSPRTSNNPC